MSTQLTLGYESKICPTCKSIGQFVTIQTGSDSWSVECKCGELISED